MQKCSSIDKIRRTFAATMCWLQQIENTSLRVADVIEKRATRAVDWLWNNAYSSHNSGKPVQLEMPGKFIGQHFSRHERPSPKVFLFTLQINEGFAFRL